MKMNLQLIVLIGGVLESSFCSPSRSRRVINGVSVEDRPRNYAAIRYYGAVATAHHTWYTFGKVIGWVKDFGWYGSVYCSGTLLTPAIFQTACHCVADFDLSNANEFIKPPVIHHHWEGRKVVYVGLSNRFGDKSMITYEYVLTEKFIVHSLCGGLGSENAMTHDYALIQIDSGWLHRYTGGYNWLEILWAPQYTSKQINDFHTQALQNQLVCMMVGFGEFDENLPYGSDVLRIGWTVLMTHIECIYETSLFAVGKTRIWVRPEYFNWVCSKPLPARNEFPGPGDSGGPLSCDNRYFGILSGDSHYTDKNGKKYDVIGKYHPLIYSLFANAVDYRSHLINSIYRLKEKYTEIVDRSGAGGYALQFQDSKALVASSG